MMKSNHDLTKDIIKKAKTARKKKRIIGSSIALCVCALLCFFIGYSNIITIDFTPYKNSYASYLYSYFCKDDGVGFRFVDKKSAVVQIENKAYPCSYQASSANNFTLTVVQSEETRDIPTEEEPSMFYLEFWDTNAKLSWNILGYKVEKILSVTESQNIPAGLWSLCATQDGNNGKIVEKKNGAGWTLILENGDSYTGEGMDSAWKTKFISIGNTLFQCMFDPISGVILDASVFVYDETTFDYPVIKEHYLSDGDPYYFYSRLLAEEEKLDFTGGQFDAAVIMRMVENNYVKNPTDLHKEISKWQLTTEKSQEKSTLSANASLNLKEDGSVQLKISDNSQFKGSFAGSWYPLKHCILVVLDKKSELVGRVFTIYASSGVEAPTGEYVQQYGQSYVESYACYKTGYHVFDYYVTESRTEIFWGDKWTPEKLTPSIKYETEYVLTGEYYYEYFDGDFSIAEANRNNFDESFLQPLPINGQVTVVFHEDGIATITHADGHTETRKFTENGDTVTLGWEVDVYQGKNAVGRNPWYPQNVDKNCVVKLKAFDIGFTSLYREWGSSWSVVDKDENGNFVQNNYHEVYYRIYLTPKFE